MVFALQPAQAVSLGILSSQAVILALLDKIVVILSNILLFVLRGLSRARGEAGDRRTGPPRNISQGFGISRAGSRVCIFACRDL